MSQTAENAVLQPLEHDAPFLTEGKLDLQDIRYAGCTCSVEHGVGRLSGDPGGGGQPRHLKNELPLRFQAAGAATGDRDGAYWC